VLGLMFMRFAIALLGKPCSKYSNTSRLLVGVRLNCRENLGQWGPIQRALVSSRTAYARRAKDLWAHESTQNCSAKIPFSCPDRNSSHKGRFTAGPDDLLSSTETFAARSRSEVPEAWVFYPE